jgi:predicted transposase YdaD
LDYLKYSEQEKRAYGRYKESLHYQASMYETNYTAARLEGKMEGEKEGLRKGIEEGIMAGKIQTLQENILQILTLRFEVVSDEINARIFTLQAVDELTVLLKKAMTIVTLNDLF